MHKAPLYIIITALASLSLLNNSCLAEEIMPISSTLRQELSVESEELISQSYLATLRANEYILPDFQVQEYIQNIGYKLAAKASIKDFKPNFLVLDINSVNASASFGANIAVNYPLILLTEDESELAGVLAHELAHVMQNHLLQQIAHQRKMLPIALAGSLAAVLIGIPELIIPVLSVGHQHSINFTREHEKEADRIGMQILGNSNYCPYGMSNMFARMSEKGRYNSKNIEYVSTHPLYENRIAETQSLANKYKYRQSASSLAYQLIKIRLEIMRSNNLIPVFAKYKKLYEQENTNLIFKYAYAYCLLHSGKEKIAAQLSWEPNENLLIELLIAQIEASYNLNLALKRLEKLVLINPSSQSTIFMLADFLLQTKTLVNALKAKSLMLAFLEKNTAQPHAYEILRIAAGMLGQQSLVYFCNANWFALHGNLDECLIDLNKTLSLLPKNSPQYRAIIKLKQNILQTIELIKNI
jgi:predicted Zn-dependent protease